MKTIEELKKIWEHDKEAFKFKELGGLQNFVAEVFKCSELFNLKQGFESTKIENRNCEFTIEANKNGRRADIVIFYKKDEIIIPVEVEKFGNIKAGIKQLANYQNDYQKAYGILTDGYHWRFYNNTLYIEFTIDRMLENPSEVNTFWNDYLKEENYYLSLFEKTGQLSLFKAEEALTVDDNRELFFEDITKLIKHFKDKLGIVGYLAEKGTPDSDKKATEISYAYFIQFILYKNLVDNCFGKFNEEFDIRISNIYNCLKNKAYQGITSQIYGISHFISDKLYKPFNKEQEFINQKLHEVLCKPDVMLEEVTLWLDIIVFIKKYNFANLKNEIFGFIYENYLKELYEETNKGQYFTDPAVVNFMLDEIGYTPKEIQKLYDKKELDKLSIIDPSCGSGTFLYSAVHRIVETLFDGSEDKSKIIEEIINNNIFGLDIAEFPLYLAEMNILMRLLPIIVNENYNNPIDKKIKIFKTQDSISEFMDTNIKANTESFENEVIQGTQQKSLFESQLLDLSYKSYIRDEDDLKEMKDSMQPPRRRFDFVIGNPPYIGYKECCTQKILFTQLKEVSMSNIYGVNLNTAPGFPKPYAPTPNLYAFFIALGGALLKPNGRMCYIIPQTILTSTPLDVIRYYLSTKVTVEKIITFSGQMFIGRGLKGKKPVATSSLIFVIKKEAPKDDNEIEIINYTKTNENTIENILSSRGNNKISKKIIQSELTQNILNWNFLTKSQSEIKFIETYSDKTLSIEEYRNQLSDYDLIQFDRGMKFEKAKINESQNGYALIKKDKHLNKILSTKQYIEDKYIKLPLGSQGLKIFQNKYKIIWSYMNYDKFYFSSENIMIDYNWIIISSNDKEETTFLYSILNSKITTKIIDFYLRIPNEQAILLGLTPIKQFVRIPKINQCNQYLKEKIIEATEMLFDIEDLKLSDCVDFSNITMQKFDKFELENNKLILIKDNNFYPLQIKNVDKKDAIAEALRNRYKLTSDINLTELKNLKIIDNKEQSEIKDYIDDLVFSLYFDIPIKNVDISNAHTIKSECKNNQFYELLAGE